MSLKDRSHNVRGVIQREVRIVKDVLGDIKERVDLDSETEPRSTRNIGGEMGKRGSLLKTLPHFAIRTVDNVLEGVQGFARNNRRMIKRGR